MERSVEQTREPSNNYLWKIPSFYCVISVTARKAMATIKSYGNCSTELISVTCSPVLLRLVKAQKQLTDYIHPGCATCGIYILITAL
ncbi:hypothetical protein RRG08_028108 [Elysia crispata]|uniref:Uncharacterized protein n=1 Tax=Elysia crispata TaxID=231223 RepID=A0AAE1DSG5_9GAST|nr:hypothetical protein RRG08_028108 [Elysia crispata]